MTTQPINHDQAKALAAFIHAIRGDWDTEGIVTALGHARTKATAPELAVAAIRCAADHTNRTPAVIGMDGKHWRPEPPPPKTGTVTAARCPKCNWFHGPGDNCDPAVAQQRLPDPHAAAAQVRRALQEEINR